MRFLVIGAKGFVGAGLVRALLGRGHAVTALEPREGPGRLADVASDVEWVVGDGSTVEAVLSALGGRDVDGVYYGPFQRAPTGRPGLDRELDVMAVGAWRLFGLARGLDIGRIVFPSSTAVHGPQPADGSPVSETTRVSPFGLYGAYKLLCERVGDEVNASVGRNAVVSVRLPAVYGPGAEIASRRVNVPAVAAARCLPGRVDYVPGVRVCIAHVEDIAATLATVLEAAEPRYSLYEAGGLDVSFADIAETVQALAPHAVTQFGDDEHPVLPNLVDWSRLRSEFSVQHRGLRAGMASVLEYEATRAA